MDNTFDKMYYDRGELIGGIDESGVVDMAGPLVAACVILPKIDIHRDDLRIFEVNDCKQIPERFRPRYAEIVWQVATAIGIGEASPIEVDYLGNTNAIRLAMTRAVAACQTVLDQKSCLPDFLLIDGGPSNLLDIPIPQEAINKGDTKSLAIAAASIVAKVYRDGVMLKLHEQHPEYDWENNKGHHCEYQLSGLDKSGIRIGVHRIRSWPFLSTKTTERRRPWKDLTASRMLGELKDRICNLKKPS